MEWRTLNTVFGVRGTLTFFFLIGVFIPTLVLSDASVECNTCIKFNNVCYNITYLYDLEANFRKKIVISQMGILRSEDILYYSFEPDISDQEYNKVGFVNLNEPSKHGIISASNYSLNLKTFDMDQTNKIIYLGGSDGIHKFDTKAKHFEHFSSYGDIILSIFYKNGVYFVRDDEKEIIVKKGKEFDSILISDRNKDLNQLKPKLAIKNFVITNDNVVVFLSTYGLYATKAVKDANVVLLSKRSFFRGLTVDLDGAVYAWWLDGIYKVVLESDLAKSRIEKVAKIPNIGCMTFDNANNVLFTMERSLFSLTKTNLLTC